MAYLTRNIGPIVQNMAYNWTDLKQYLLQMQPFRLLKHIYGDERQIITQLVFMPHMPITGSHTI